MTFVRSFTATPERWALGALFVLMLAPGLDLPVSAAFYMPETNFRWTIGGFPEVIRTGMPDAIIASVVICALLWLGARFKTTWPQWITTPRLAYLMSTLLLGPGLIVETVLKPVWGRARPKDITDFGGDAAYTPPWQIAHECVSNCSFVSGHAAIAFWLTAYAFLLPARLRAAVLWAGVVFGLAVGVIRIAQGGHFLSDVAAAGFIVVLVNSLLARVILKPTPV